MTTTRILRLPDVRARAGICRTTVYDRIARGTWTRGVKLGARAVGWPKSEVEAIVAAHVAGWDEDRIRTLVDRLHASRATAVDHLLGAQ